ncbi:MULTISPECIES: SRPBCC family protein [unclassified Blastococcus]
MKDLIDELGAATRAVERRPGDDGELVSVVVRRSYPFPADDVWDAVTDPGRLARWFGPVSGDLRPGGSFSVEGNAGGDVLACEPPRLLRVSWGAPESVVTVRLSATGESTTLELEHTVPVAFAGSGAGALFVGPGWDVSIVGLGLHLAGAEVGDPGAWESTPEVRALSAATVEEWERVVTASGTATAEEVAGAVAAARAQFAPDPV